MKINKKSTQKENNKKLLQTKQPRKAGSDLHYVDPILKIAYPIHANGIESQHPHI